MDFWMNSLVAENTEFCLQILLTKSDVLSSQNVFASGLNAHDTIKVVVFWNLASLQWVCEMIYYQNVFHYSSILRLSLISIF